MMRKLYLVATPSTFVERAGDIAQFDAVPAVASGIVADARGLETVLKGVKEKARNDDAMLSEATRIFDHWGSYQDCLIPHCRNCRRYLLKILPR